MRWCRMARAASLLATCRSATRSCTFPDSHSHLLVACRARAISRIHSAGTSMGRRWMSIEGAVEGAESEEDQHEIMFYSLRHAATVTLKEMHHFGAQVPHPGYGPPPSYVVLVRNGLLSATCVSCGQTPLSRLAGSRGRRPGG